MAHHWKFAIGFIALLALIGLATLPALFRNVVRLQRASVTEEQARRELIQPSISTPNDTREKVQLFWASAMSPTALESIQVELPLATDPVLRSKQLIVALITQAPSPAQRTLPADAELLQFYLLPDGTAIADFSEALGTKTPSGILSEQMAVDSLVRTLAENVSAVHLLKILIRGQEVDTLAGHLDLTGFFPVESAAQAASPTPDNSSLSSEP